MRNPRPEGKPHDHAPQDLRYAIRWLVRIPGFTAVAVLTLALGIGTVTTIFSILDAAVLRPLPYRDSDELMTVAITHREGNASPETFVWSSPKFESLRRHASSFERVAAHSSIDLNLTGVAEPERLAGEIVSPAYFSVLGVDAALGRTFGAEEEKRRRGSGHRSLLGPLAAPLRRRPRDSRKDDRGQSPAADGRRRPPGAVRGPLRQRRDVGPDDAGRHLHVPRDPARGRDHWHLVVARRKAGVSAAAAQAEMEIVGARIARGQPDGGQRRDLGRLGLAPQRQPRGSGPSPLGSRPLRRRDLRSPHRVRERRRADDRPGGLARGREVAIRLAIGAGRGADPPAAPDGERGPVARRRPRRSGPFPLGRRVPLAPRAPLRRRRSLLPVSLRGGSARRPRPGLRARRVASRRDSSSAWPPRFTPREATWRAP